ncbi:MAG TPA: cation-translocating P-type ATPase [Candidatus Bathyarchaeia archaeon]|nr:cation-translocating P-type ATPase [Candidatus Bathyarchaeia archaeon]
MPENHSRAEESCSACATDIFEEKEPLWKQKEVIIIGVAAAIFLIGVYFEAGVHQHILAQIAFLAATLVSGYSIIKKGLFGAIKKHRIDMNLLITIAAAGAFAIGLGEEGAAVMLLFFIAEFLEDYAGDRARQEVGSLLRLAPETAVVVRGGSEIVVHAHEVKVGEVVVVKPGEKIPLDGVVINGMSSVNQAPLTGESVPVVKTDGDTAFAGTVSEDGYLELRVTKRSDETIVSRIVQLVDEAQRKKTPTEAFIDRFSYYYTPIVIALAVLVVVIPVIVFGLSFSEWFYRGLVLLVISCPCAMAISTPVSMVSGLTAAARKGILIKGGDVIEELKDVKVVIFDKTRTLTEGRLTVTDVVSLNGATESEVVRIAASFGAKSTHPAAQAIAKKAEEEKVELVPITDFKSIAGKGLTGRFNGDDFYVGSRTFLESVNSHVSYDSIDQLEIEGKTLMLVGTDTQIIGVIGLKDRIRESSAGTLRALTARGIKTIMLTGDNERAAAAIANELPLSECYAGLLPDDKVRHVEELTTAYKHVVMVGDGVNDAPAMARANVGIAMGAAGSDVAIETADIALMHDDLSKVTYLVDLSTKTMSVVRENVTAAILIKAVFAVLAFQGVISLWLAVGVGDMGLSLAVILNALRIGSRR